ncbi:hypothetical protein WOC08_23365 [Vibrio parahaemolyticus]|nr:hypothetical protein [Vibrio parahaemolyticus]MBM4891807.1 hypothetical protein [Vibrio parahaemolyticus]MDF4995330.1 hypothetical protein [Vibrio parahaemolyticus]HCE2594242.1 hypothetical protein [Vibrio parahaemolyticus]HCG9220483.1 hypothetical protein [Vibrio parahaemolyticus]
MDKVLSYINQIMDRADSFNYFVFLSTFVIFVDGILLYEQGASIYDLNFSYIQSNVTIGSFLVFLCVYSMFMAVIVTGAKHITSQIVLALPTIKWLQTSDYRNYRNSYSKNYVSSSQMRIYAIKNDNAVAFGVVAEKQREIRNLLNLEKNCFAFLLASTFSLIIGFGQTPSLVVRIFTFSSNAGLFTFESLKVILVMAVYLTMFYIGVIRGCGFQNTHIYNNDIYFPENDIKN